MAGQDDISLKMTLDASDVESGVEGVEQKVDQLGPAAGAAGAEAAAGLGKIATAAQKAEKETKDAWAELEKLGDEGRAAADALRTLERTADSPRTLARNAGLAAFQVEDLANKLRAAGPAGEASLRKVSAAMKDAERAIDGAANKAARMKDAIGDLGAKSAMAGDGIATLRSSAGSLDTMFDRMRETGTGATKTIGALGVGVSVAATAIMGAVAAGKQLADAIDAIDAKRAKKDKVDADAAVKAILLNAANGAVTRGLIEQGATVDQTIDRYVQMTVKMGKLTEQGRAYIASVAQMKAPVAWSEIERQANAMALALEGAYKRSEEEGHRWALENAAGLKAIIAEYDRVGKVVPEALVKAVAEAEKWAAANEKAALSARGVGTAASEAAAGVDALGTAIKSISGADAATSIAAVVDALDELKAQGGDVGTAVAGSVYGLVELQTAAAATGETLTSQIPAYEATALSMQKYAGAFEALDAMTAATDAYWEARSRANDADIAAGQQLANLKAQAADAARSIDTIGEAWARATGQAAGFTVEVRHATQAVKETTPEFDAFIEALAQTSDEYERMTPYVGALIADLEAGRISTTDFRTSIEGLKIAFMQIQGVSGQMFGDLDSLWNKLNGLLNEFTRGKK